MSIHHAVPARVLAHLVEHIGDLTPTDRDMGALFGVRAQRVSNAIAKLISENIVYKAGRKANRHFYFRDHQGCTLPVVGDVQPPPAVVIEPVRVINFTCPRCGARNCERHGIYVDGWQRFVRVA